MTGEQDIKIKSNNLPDRPAAKPASRANGHGFEILVPKGVLRIADVK